MVSLEFSKIMWLIEYSVQSTPVCCGHARNHDLVSVIARVRNSGPSERNIKILEELHSLYCL